MGLQSALSTALTGLNAAETIIDVAGNNVANSQTVGFKESGVNFATQFLQTISIGAAPSQGNGGTNPRQIGLGVKVAEISQDFTQGTIEISSNPLDVAIQGDGFLIVQGGQGEQLYTRNGQLKTNQNNEVISITGNRVLGYNAVNGVIVENLEPLVIPIGGSVVNKVTSTASFSGTLSPKAAIGVGNIIESDVLSNGDFPIPSNFPTGSFSVTPPIDVTGATGSGDSTPPGPSIPAAGTYSYRITYVNGGLETAGSTAFTVTSTGGNIELSNLPTPDGTVYTGYNIYRTTDGGTQYFKVNTTPISSADNTFEDTVHDDDLESLPALNTSALAHGSNSSYSYYVTYYRQADGIETRPTGLQGPITVNSPNQRIRIDNIPQPSAAEIADGFTQLRIYRTVAGSNENFYELATIPTGQTSYMDSASDASIQNNNTIDLDGPKITNDTRLLDVVQRSGSSYRNVFTETGTLTFKATRGGKETPLKSFEIGLETTVLDYLDFLQQALGINTNVPDSPAVVVSNGKITVESNKGLANAIQIGPASFEFKPNTPGSTPQVKNLGFEQIRQAAGEGTTAEFVVYDSLGIPLTVQLTTVIEQKNDSSTVWRWFATSGDNEPLQTVGSPRNVSTVVGTGTIVYDTDGILDLASSSLPTVIIERNDTAARSPLDFQLDFSQTNGKESGVSRMNFTTQDGFPPGVLTDFSITETGEIRGVYSNGIGQTLGQIVMARFTNNTGLQQVGSNMYTIGVNSGSPQYGIPGDAGIGSLTAGAVELSNTDIGQNLIELILASTQYRGGARVITAVQELLDELMALRR